MENATAFSTKTNLQVVQQGFNDFATGNIPGIINACTDDVIWGSYKNPDVVPSGMFYGKEGVQEFFSSLAQNISYTQFEPTEFIAQGDRVMVLGHHSGRVKNTGKTFDHDWCMSFTMSNGKIHQYFAFVDTRDQSLAFK